MDDSNLADESNQDSRGRVKLSVILPVRNGQAYLGEQLNALVNQECSFVWELIVVDNGSSDSSLDIARVFQSRSSNVRVISEPRAGKSYALKAGKVSANGDCLVLVDADDIVAPRYLENMVSALDNYEMVSGCMDTTLLNAPGMQQEYISPDEIKTILGFLPYMGGGIIGIRSSVWERIGDFATDLVSAEDVDFSWRAHLLGVTTSLVPGAVLHYRRPQDAWSNFLKSRSYGRAHVWLFERYRALGQPRLSIRVELHHIKLALLEVIRHEAHWKWRMAWHLGLVEGRLEESIRRRTWYL